MSRFRLAALLTALAVAPACGHGDTASTTSPSDALERAEVEWASWEPRSFERAEQEQRIILINVVAT